MTIATVIIQVVFSYFGVPVELKDNPTRKRDKVIACQFSMYFLRKYTHLSLSEAGFMFGRDHATTIHSCKKIDYEMSRYKDTRLFVDQINKRILANIQIDDFRYSQYDTDKT